MKKLLMDTLMLGAFQSLKLDFEKETVIVIMKSLSGTEKKLKQQ